MYRYHLPSDPHIKGTSDKLYIKLGQLLGSMTGLNDRLELQSHSIRLSINNISYPSRPGFAIESLLLVWIF